MRKFAMSTAVIGAGILASGLAANAQYFDFTTSWSAPITDNGDTLTFAPQSATNVNSQPFGSDIITGKLNITGLNPGSNPIVGGGYTETINITDLNLAGPAATKTDVFTGGVLTGGFSSTGSNIVNHYGSITSIVNTYSNGDVFTVTLDGFTPPQAATSTSLAVGGSFSALVTFSSNVTPTSTPEPGAIATLFGISVPGVLLGARRRRNKASV